MNAMFFIVSLLGWLVGQTQEREAGGDNENDSRTHGSAHMELHRMWFWRMQLASGQKQKMVHAVDHSTFGDGHGERRLNN